MLYAHSNIANNAAELEARMRQADMACIMDMGTFLLPKVVGQRLVVQLVVPGLEERARAFPALGGCHHTPGALPLCHDPHMHLVYNHTHPRCNV